MKKYLIFIVLLLIGLKCNAQKNEFKIVKIDSLNYQYVIDIQSLKNKKITTIFTYKIDSLKDNEKIKVGEIYKFTFINKYIYGNPNFQKNEDGSQNYVIKKTKFKKNIDDHSYSVNELQGLSYKKNDSE